MHDRHGKPLAVGDKVVVECTITTCHDSNETNEYCNVTLTTDVPMAGNAYNITLNAKQTTKVE